MVGKCRGVFIESWEGLLVGGKWVPKRTRWGKFGR